MSTGCWNCSSVTVPPVKSSAKLKPRVAIAPMEMTSSASATNAAAWRIFMNGMALSYGNTFRGFMDCSRSDRDRLQLAPATVDERGDPVGDRHRGVHGGDDAQDQRDREALHRPGTEGEQRQAREQ